RRRVSAPPGRRGPAGVSTAAGSAVKADSVETRPAHGFGVEAFHARIHAEHLRLCEERQRGGVVGEVALQHLGVLGPGRAIGFGGDRVEELLEELLEAVASRSSSSSGSVISPVAGSRLSSTLRFSEWNWLLITSRSVRPTIEW